MASTKVFTAVWMLCAHVLVAMGSAAFSGNFEITDLLLECPSEVDTSSTASSSLSFNFVDQDTPDNPSVHCCLEWSAGKEPGPIATEGTCSDDNVTVSVPDGQYGGFDNMTVLLAHEYEDDSIGQYPYNILTKYANMALDYQDTPNYECDREIGSCELAPGDTLVAVVTLATA